jgi:hypothetical protein
MCNAFGVNVGFFDPHPRVRRFRGDPGLGVLNAFGVYNQLNHSLLEMPKIF